MSSWDMGYNSDTLYTYGYYQELNPLRAKFFFTELGFATPDFENGYACELGFGQGVSVNMHALCSKTQWYGNDFNPSQVSFAQHLASETGTNVVLKDDAFGEFCERDDLPMFDFIGLHGIWSWISKENQQYIVNFLKKHLKVGGVFYISYNVSPGFMAFEPVRHIMFEFDKHNLPTTLTLENRIKGIETFLDHVLKAHPDTIKNTPSLEKRTKDMLKHDKHYICGEYLNSHWDISHFSEIAKQLETAKMSFALSAEPTQLIPNYYLTPQQQKFLNTYQNSTSLYESARDFTICQQFRKDYFAKGLRKLPLNQKEQALNSFPLILKTQVQTFDFDVKTRIGQPLHDVIACKAIFKVVLDHKTHTFAEIIKEAVAIDERCTPAQIREALLNLIHTNVIAPAVSIDELDEEVVARCKEFNRKVLLNDEAHIFNHLASPVIQGAVLIQPLKIEMLKALVLEPKHDVKSLTDLLFTKSKQMNIGFKHNNDIAEEPEKQKEIMQKHVKEFFDLELPIYKSLALI